MIETINASGVSRLALSASVPITRNAYSVRKATPLASNSIISAGRAFGNDCVIVCRNHHRKLTDKQKEHPPIKVGKPSLDECRGRRLLGIADALELLNNPEQLVRLIRQIGLDLIEAGQRSSADVGEPR
jgi:hypothetical protein